MVSIQIKFVVMYISQVNGESEGQCSGMGCVQYSREIEIYKSKTITNEQETLRLIMRIRDILYLAAMHKGRQ